MDLKFKLNKDKKPKDLAHFSYTNINIGRDWHFILLGFLIINILGVIFSAYLFFTSNHHLGPEEPASGNPNASQISRLHATVSKYDDKRKAYEKALVTEPTVPDPSL